ncbi:MAG: ribonuclease E activity regulator RraA [Bacillus sp. (in: firmicutes)]
MTFKTADLCDEYSEDLDICELDFKSYGKRKQFCGPISTVRVYEDNVLVKEALQSVPAGHVLVVDGGGSRKRALMGDMLAEIAVRRQLAGVIINGCIRDSADMAEMDIGVLAIGTVPLKSIKQGKGEKDIALYFGGVNWQPGDYAYCDEDGIVLSKRQLQNEH